MGIKGSADPLNNEHESKQSEEDPDNANLLPSKRNRIASDGRNMADENRSSVNVSDDWNIISKKMQCDASYVLQSTEQNQIPLHGKELLGDLSERERCDFAENQMGTMDGSTALEKGCDDCTSSNRCGQSNGNAVHKSQSENHLNATSMPQDKSLDEAHQDSCVDQTKHDSCLHPEPRASNVAPPDGAQHKVSAKVFNFNSEHNFHSADGPQEKSISENGNGLVAKNLADENHKSVIGSDDCCVIAKKVKWDPSYVLLCIEKMQIPLHGRELLEDSSERDVLLPERERCVLAESQMGTMARGKVIEDGHNDHTTSKRCGQSTDHAVNKSQSENPCNTGSLPRDTFQDEAPIYTHIDEVKDDGGLHPEQRESCVAAPDETLHKVSAEVLNRNSELAILVKVSLPASTDEPQQKSIADEGKDDEHCPEPRASSIASLDETQYDSSSENDSHIKVAHPASTDESPKKSIADEARELLDWLCHYESDISTDRVEFHDEKIDVIMKKHSLLSSQSTSSQYSSETTKNLCKKPNEGGLLICNTSNCSVVVHENWLSSSAILYEKDNFKCPFYSYTLDLTEYLDSKKRALMLKKDLDAFIHSLEHQPEERLGSQHNKENICMRKFREDLNAKTKGHQNGHLGKSVEHLEKQCEERANEINDLQLQNITGTEQQVAPSGSCIRFNSECRDESVTLVGINLDVSTGEKEWREKVIQTCISVVGLDGCENQVPAKGDTLSSKSALSLLADKRQAVVTEQEDLQHITNAQEVQGHALNIDSEQAGARMSSTSNYNTRLRTKNPYTSPTISQLRQIKVPWSVEEEEMLKKGSSNISKIDERTLPWKQILEFGGSVFLHSRTPVELKNKWRNIRRRRLKLN